MARPRPIGMRIPRPYDSEDDFIRGDGLAIGRLGMILIGAPKRPPGITIRFEVLLNDGTAVFRGEGRVVAHRVHANGRGGLEIRFTRLDSHSKEVVGRVLNLRRSGALTPQNESDPETRPQSPPKNQQKSSISNRAPDPPAPSDRRQRRDQNLSVKPEDTSQPHSDSQESALEKQAVDQLNKPTAEGPKEPVEEPSVEVPSVENLANKDAPRDENVTPLAPPVMFNEEHDSKQNLSSSTAPEVMDSPSTEPPNDVDQALSKLRERAAQFDTPPSSKDLLNRLRERVKTG